MGTTIPASAGESASAMSSSNQAVATLFTRTKTCAPRPAISGPSVRAFARPSAFAFGGVASSQSITTPSAPLAGSFAMKSGRTAGANSSERRRSRGAGFTT